jgi:ribokinase
MRVAVVGHVEWVQFARVERVPGTGDIVHADETWEEAAGGGAVAAVRLAELVGGASLYTSLGGDELGSLAAAQLEARGVTVHATRPLEPQRRAFCFVDEAGERTITVLGRKLVPSGDAGELPWEELAGADAVYFVSGDVAALRQARRGRVLVATSRELQTLRAAGVLLDGLVGSGKDESEVFHPGDLDPPPRLAVSTAGSLGGWAQPGGPYRAAAPAGPIEDAYGCGDAFAAGLALALGRGLDAPAAVEFAAQRGADALTVRGAGVAGAPPLTA